MKNNECIVEMLDLLETIGIKSTNKVKQNYFTYYWIPDMNGGEGGELLLSKHPLKWNKNDKS